MSKPVVDQLVATLRERASYLRAMAPEGLSQIERQSMEAMEQGATHLERVTEALRSAYVTMVHRPEVPIMPFLEHIISGGDTATYALSSREPPIDAALTES